MTVLAENAGDPCEAWVWLIDGNCIHVDSRLFDDEDATAKAGALVGQDIGHLVNEVEWR